MSQYPWFEPIPTEVLEAQQGITGPQGLDALADPNWVDDEASRRFLEVVLGSPRPHGSESSEGSS